MISEHTGFANILAQLIASILNLSAPALSYLSSFAPNGSVTNGSFGKSTIPGITNGGRLIGTIKFVKSASYAKHTTSYLNLDNEAWVTFANHANPGDTISVTGWLQEAQNGDLRKLKLEFIDQAQNTIGNNGGLVTLTTHWQQVTTTTVAPVGTWSVWVVLAAENRGYVSFDNVQLTWR